MSHSAAAGGFVAQKPGQFNLLIKRNLIIQRNKNLKRICVTLVSRQRPRWNFYFRKWSSLWTISDKKYEGGIGMKFYICLVL